MWGSHVARTDVAEPQPGSQKGRGSRRRSRRSLDGLTSFTELPYAEHWLRSAGSEAATASSPGGYQSDSMTFSRRVQPRGPDSPELQGQSEARGISWVKSAAAESQAKASPRESSAGKTLGETRSDRRSPGGTHDFLSSARPLSPASRLLPSEPEAKLKRSVSSDSSPGQPLVMQGYDADAVQPRLRYGDSIYLLPEGRNGIMAYAGADDDTRPWIEYLNHQVGNPPNLRDCQWRLQPPREYEQARNLQKLLKSSDWDDGKKLPLPPVPRPGEDLDVLANTVVAKHRLHASKADAVRDVLIALRMVKEEQDGNLVEQARQRGTALRFGSALILIHESTGNILSLTKHRALERTAKKVEVIPEGNNCSVLVIRPAFKTHALGTSVASGDLVSFQTKKAIAASHYSLHMSASEDLERDGKRIARALKVDHPYIEGGQEINGVAGDDRPTLFRAMLFSALESVDAAASGILKCEDVVAFYHKHHEAYLSFDPCLSRKPMFYKSQRVNVKSRKKCAWLWKLEKCNLQGPGADVTASESEFFRIKHLVTNVYLMQKGSGMTVTKDYKQRETLFAFKHFVKQHVGERISTSDMIYIKGARGEWMTAANVDDGNHRTMPIKLQRFDLAPDSDGLTIMPVRHSALQAVLQVRRLVLVLEDFSKQLKELPDCRSGADAVVKVVAENYDRVRAALRTLVVNCSWGEDPDPMSRDGVPNAYLQKLLRELSTGDLLVANVQLPFTKGVLIDELMGKNRARFAPLVTLLNLQYRLLKQMAKENSVNSKALYGHLAVYRSHLGKGILCTPTIKEIFAGERELLNLITVDIIDQFVLLLKEDKAPQYIDFLMSICVDSSGPLPKIQSMITDRLFIRNENLMPNVRLESRDGTIVMRIHVMGSKDLATREELWIDLARFKTSKEVRGREQDYLGWITTATLSELTETEKNVRYFIRCLNLCAMLTAGRCQESLQAVIGCQSLAMSYPQVLAVIQEETLPYLLRARYIRLMSKLYVDRDPQATKPLVAYTRVWSKVMMEESDLDMTPQHHMSIVPVCTTGFKDLEALLLKLLPKLADCRNPKTGRPSLNHDPKIGQLEMLNAQILLVDQMVSFGFFVEASEESEEADLSQISSLFSSLFAALDTRDESNLEKSRSTDASVEARLRNKLRSDALNVLSRFFDMRLNVRMCRVIRAWEAVFETIESNPFNIKHVNAHSSITRAFSSKTVWEGGQHLEEDPIRVIREHFPGFDQLIDQLNQACFRENIVSPPEIGTDVYSSCAAGDSTIKVMLDLCSFKHAAMTKSCLTLAIRNMSQRVALTRALDDVQILVFPTAVKVYHETLFIIKTLGSLHKQLNADKAEAYQEAIGLLARMTKYLVESITNTREIVMKNALIMLNLDVDRSVRNILSLYLERDTSRRDQGELEADIPVNVPRRDLHQACYTFLKVLAHKNPKAQEKLFEHINFFVIEHMGLEKLNVADTVSEIVRNNTGLCARISESFLRLFINAIKTWGRRARWLSFLEVFILVNGQPLKRNQDLILRLLLEEQDTVIDLTCDYSHPACCLSKNDARYGKSRLELIVDKDHQRPIYSLIKYHKASVNLLALCASGKNAQNQGKVGALIPFSDMVKNALFTDVGTGGRIDARAEADALRFVQAPWIGIMADTFLNNNDSHSIRQVQDCDLIFDQAEEGIALSANRSLMALFASSMDILVTRLKKLNTKHFAGNPELLNGLRDEEGDDIGSHFTHVVEILRACTAFYVHYDVFAVPERAKSAQVHSQRIRNSAVKLYGVVLPFHFDRIIASIVELVTCMTSLGIEGERLILNEVAKVALPRVAGREDAFREGWSHFRIHFARTQGIDVRGSESMNNAIKDIALMFGSKRTHANEQLQSLKELMRMLCDKECEDNIRLTGLKAIRAIVYMNPDQDSLSAHGRNSEFELMLQNKPSSLVGNSFFAHQQARMAKMGGVDVIAKCIESQNPQVIMATLQLAVSLLEGGNIMVQRQFAEVLHHSASQSFFVKLRGLFQESVRAIREQKRKAKRAAVENAALLKAGITKKCQESSLSLSSTQMHMVEVMKTMRRMCMEQFRPLQDVLRTQPLNHSSFDFFNEAVEYLKNLEPELKSAILDNDFEIVDGAIRGFLMLADSMRGPNVDNQRAISQTGIFDICDRIFARIRFDCIDRNSKKSELDVKLYSMNEYRSSLKCAVTSVLAALVEGVQDETIMGQMLSLLNWHGLVDQMKHCHETYERGNDLPKEQCEREGISYYFLLKHLQHYDKDACITRALSYASAKVVKFYECRTGYVEIARAGHLERVFFKLPAKCVSGQPFDLKPFDEMYAIDQCEEFDKKNRDFVENMVSIVDKIQFHDKIRQTRLSWTVTRWDLIRQINFLWTCALHFLLIFGGYMPYYSKVDYADSVKKWREGSVDADAGFGLTEYDVFFFENVAPRVEWIARIMSWVNLLTCSVRFIAFIHSEMPIIVRRKLEEEAEEAEEDVVEEEQPSQEEEEHLDVVFIEHSHQKAGAAEVVQTASGADSEVDEKPVKSQRWRSFRAAMTSSTVAYEIAFCLSPVLAVVMDEPLWSIYALFEICSWKGSKTVIDAIVINFAKMGQALLLGLLFMYSWMVLGLVTLRPQHSTDLCSNMFQCFFTYLFRTTVDGARAVLTEPGEDFKFPHNLWDALVGSDEFIWRVCWDLAFQVIFIYILLAIITGIVIDAFGALKEKKEAAEENLQSICFVCNIDRFTADQSGIGFDKHVRIEHNPKWYLFFLLYLQSSPQSSMTGQEHYVLDKVWPAAGSGARDFRWLPREVTFTISKGDDIDHTAQTMAEVQRMSGEMLKLNTIMSKVDALAAAVARLEAANHASTQ